MKHVPRLIYGPRFATWVIIDAACGALVALIAFQNTPHADIIASSHLGIQWAVFLMAVFTTITAHICDLHNTVARKDPWTLTVKTIIATVGAVSALVLYANLVRFEQVGRYIALELLFYLPPFLLGARWLLFHGWLKEEMRILIIGDITDYNHLKQALIEGQLPIKIVEHTTNPDHLDSILKHQAVEEIVYCGQVEPSSQMLEKLISYQAVGVQIVHVAIFLESHLFRIPHKYINASWFLLAGISHLHSVYHMFKRGIDIVIASTALLLSSPIMLFIALVIKLEGKGPVFYSQLRVGSNGNIFRIWKFRTMRTDAEANGPQYAQTKDARTTKFGKWLRRTRLDETPQFWNIIKGTMSFIGPRPERPEFVQQFEQVIPYYAQRHIIKPGLSGWAQIHYPYAVGVEDAANKLEYDLYYIKNLSLALDIQIILRTIGAIMKGAR